MAYTVLDNLDHDGRRYAPGDTVELAAETARHLAGLGVVAWLPEPAPDAGAAVAAAVEAARGETVAAPVLPAESFEDEAPAATRKRGKL